jgi:hypothetical protein
MELLVVICKRNAYDLLIKEKLGKLHDSSDKVSL